MCSEMVVPSDHIALTGIVHDEGYQHADKSHVQPGMPGINILLLALQIHELSK